MRNRKWDKRGKLLLSLMLVSALAVSLTPEQKGSAAKWKNWVRLNQKIFYMRVGKSARVKLLNSKKKVAWKVISGNQKIFLSAQKKTSVQISAFESGTAKIRATASGKNYYCKVIVKKQKGTAASDEVVVTPTPAKTAVPTLSPTPTATPTPARVVTPVPTLSPTPIPTATPTVTPTASPVPHDETEERALQLILRSYGVPSNSDSTVPDGQEWSKGHLTKLNLSDLSLPGTLDLSAFPMLTWLRCDNNFLTEIDVTKNTMLDTLYCNNNKLTALDLSKNFRLQKLECVQNLFTDLDLKANGLLEELNCSRNYFASLDLTGNSILKKLYCTEGRLVSLDVSKNSMLSLLDCSFNYIEKLDVTNCVMLQSLNCTANKISGVLDLTKNYFLSVVLCTQNSISEIYVCREEGLYSIIDRNKNVPVILKYA